MLKLSLTSLLANKLRFALTGFAVLLGVSFVSAAFILADSLGESFEKLASDIAGGIEFQVRPRDYDFNQPANEPVPLELLEVVRGVDGVDRATGGVDDFTNAVITPENEQVTSVGAPVIVSSFEEGIGTTYAIVDGVAPGPDEIGVDSDTAEEYELAIGETLTYGSEDFTISSIFEFGPGNSSSLGAKLFIVDPETSRRITGFDDSVAEINGEVAEGFTEQEVADNINTMLPAEFEAITGEQVTEDTQNAFGDVIGILGNVLLGFAGVALLVSAFIINNTFNITLGQRIREFGLLRAIGARGDQIRTAVIAEAVLIGIISTLLGVLFGKLVALALVGLIEGAGGALPPIDTAIESRTWLVAGLIGVGVTLLASLAPAFRAAKLSPITALRDGLEQSETSGRNRLLLGGLALLVGFAMILAGLLGDTDSTTQLLTLLIPGALFVVLGVSRLSPLFAGPVSGVIGLPVAALFGTPGKMARQNAMRNPQRTSSTASALMIGLALVTMTSVVAASLKDSFTGSLSQALSADLIASPSAGQGGPSLTGVPNELAEEVAGLEGIESVARYRFGAVGTVLPDGRTGESVAVIGLSSDTSPEILDVGADPRTVNQLADGGLLVLDETAESEGLAVGDEILLSFGESSEEFSEPIIGLYSDDTLSSGLIMDIGTFDRILPPPFRNDALVMATISDDADRDQVTASAEALAEDFPQVKLTDQSGFLEDSASQLDQLLIIINGFLLMAIVIAMLGIANTMALSVFERTREIGLVRAIGMNRRQVRRMVRWESVVVSVFGAVLGIGLGVLFGWLITVAVPSDTISSMTLPVGQLLLLLLIAGVIGVVAAFFPAYRASRLDVLDAISEE